VRENEGELPREKKITLCTTKDGSQATHLRVPHDIQQVDDVLPPWQVLQDLDLTLDLLLLDGLENLDDAFLLVHDVDTFENFGVLFGWKRRRERGKGRRISVGEKEEVEATTSREKRVL
jgi:hypothetical protein